MSSSARFETVEESRMRPPVSNETLDRSATWSEDSKHMRLERYLVETAAGAVTGGVVGFALLEFVAHAFSGL